MKKSLKLGTNSILVTIVLCAILVIIYLVASNHDHVWDLTENRENTLDPKTINVLEVLEHDVMIRVFDKKGPSSVLDILDRYCAASPLVKYECVDPDMNPRAAKDYGVDQYGQTVITIEGRDILVERLSEESVTNAIVKLSRTEGKTIMFVTGHGEREIDDDGNGGISYLAGALEKAGYSVSSLLLMRHKDVPPETDMVVIAGPQKKYLKGEIEMLRRYMHSGGAVMVCIDPRTQSGLGPLLDEFGIIADDDIVIDTFSTMLGGDYTIPVVTDYGSVQGFANFSYATFYPLARSFDTVVNPGEDLSVEWIARTSENSFSEHDIDHLVETGQATLDSHDRGGPLNIAVFSTLKLDGEKAAGVMAFGDSDFISNAYILVSGNRDMFMGCVNTLLQDNSMITIEAVKIRDRPFILTAGQSSQIFWVSVVVVPGIVLVISIVVLKSRRRRV